MPFVHVLRLNDYICLEDYSSQCTQCYSISKNHVGDIFFMHFYLHFLFLNAAQYFCITFTGVEYILTL